MRGWAGAAWAIAWVILPAVANAQTPDLSFTRDPALRRCPDEPAFRAMLRGHHVTFAEGPEDPRPTPPAATRVDVRYARAERDGVRVEVRVYSGDQQVSAWSDALRAADCARDQGALALRIELSTRPPVPVRPAVSVVAPSAPREASSPVEPSAPPPAIARAAPRRRSTWLLGAFIGGGASLFALPEVEPLGVIGVALGGSGWQLRAQGVIGFARDVGDPQYPWTARRWLGDLTGCWVPSFMGVCGGVQVGALEVAVQDGGGVKEGRSMELALVVRALFDGRIVGALRAWASAEASVQIVSARVEVRTVSDTRTLWTSPGVGLSLAAGVGVQFL